MYPLKTQDRHTSLRYRVYARKKHRRRRSQIDNNDNDDNNDTINNDNNYNSENIDNNDNSDNSDVKTVIIMTTMITVTIVITCFIQNGACSCQNTWETPQEDQNIDWVTLYRTALSQPVRESALIFTLYLTGIE